MAGDECGCGDGSLRRLHSVDRFSHVHMQLRKHPGLEHRLNRLWSASFRPRTFCPVSDPLSWKPQSHPDNRELAAVAPRAVHQIASVAVIKNQPLRDMQAEQVNEGVRDVHYFLAGAAFGIDVQLVAEWSTQFFRVQQHFALPRLRLQHVPK